MPVLMVMRWADATKDEYEAVRKLVDWEGDPPEGGQFHVSSFDGGGMTVVDIWDSPEHFQRFGDERLNKGIAEVGIEGEPEITFTEVHAIWNPGVGLAAVAS
jgi:hypothetical protein